MANENNENNEKKPEGKVELSLDELEDAAGGYIVNRGYYGRDRGYTYGVVDDETGEWLTGTYTARGAEECASARGVSTEMISTEQYEKMFGKKY